ncbi:DUF6517 family protein [Natrinema longum]|uniref:Uncharacterized protein n=1 Tax=Natrinema longum TaxID=370324 RepID=A0A8A2U957_9EURY|nr:DUF6517 family protein [Natrinema longum]MBZ6493548.1 hypothetical protein [Natrinema longum]QSW85106.1 hypothetical protein J0X27_16935 [Natrinema longum]
MKRRSVLAGAGVGTIASLSGCLGLLGMDEHESSPAGVEGGAREETGYEQVAIEELPVDRDVGVGPVSETVSVVNYMTTHEKAVDIAPLEQRQRAAAFNVVTSPQVSVLGQELNPLEEMSTGELVDLVRNNYDGIENISRDEDAEITVLGQSTTRTRFTADAEFDGHSMDVDVHVTEAVDADDDLLVTIGVYPQQLRPQEEADIVSLVEAATTGVDEAASTDGSGSDGSETESGDAETDSDDESGANETGDDGILG